MMNIALTGKNGVGKDTVADYLAKTYGYRKLAFADSLRDIARLNGEWALTEEDLGYDTAKRHPWFRHYLIDLGTTIRSYDPDFFVRALAKRITDFDTPWVITDVRFQNEAVLAESMGFKVIHMFDGPMDRENPVLPPVTAVEGDLDTLRFNTPVYQLQRRAALLDLFTEIDDIMRIGAWSNGEPVSRPVVEQ